MPDLGKAQPGCEECRCRYALYHERSDLFLCEACMERYEDEHPDEVEMEDDE